MLKRQGDERILLKIPRFMHFRAVVVCSSRARMFHRSNGSKEFARLAFQSACANLPVLRVCSGLSPWFCLWAFSPCSSFKLRSRQVVEGLNHPRRNRPTQATTLPRQTPKRLLLRSRPPRKRSMWVRRKWEAANPGRFSGRNYESPTYR